MLSQHVVSGGMTEMPGTQVPNCGQSHVISFPLGLWKGSLPCSPRSQQQLLPVDTLQSGGLGFHPQLLLTAGNPNCFFVPSFSLNLFIFLLHFPLIFAI